MTRAVPCLALPIRENGGKTMKILLIEDDPETAENVAHVLRAQGHEVDSCGDGLEGAAWARERDHAAMIVDRMLPGQDGLSLVRDLRAEGIDTPILLLT